MDKPDAPARRNPNPDYVRVLVMMTELSQREVARRIGVSDRVLRYYMLPATHDNYRPMPYPEQYAIEGLVPEEKLKPLHLLCGITQRPPPEGATP